MSKELIERLRYEWRKPENKPPEMLEAADRIEQLEAENARQKEVEKSLTLLQHTTDLQLAASQAREQQLCEAILQFRKEKLLSRANGIRRTEGYAAMQYAALDMQRDTTALEAMIAKAGDVMREKCIPISFKQFLSDVHTAAGLLRYGKKDQGLADRLGKGVINYMTQTVPTVTLEDLK